MRKVTVDIQLNPKMKKAGGPILDALKSLRVIEVLKIDFEKGIKAFVAEMEFKEGHTLDEFREQKNMEVLNVLKEEGNKYTCIIKGHVPKQFKKLMKEFDLDLIWDAPMLLSNEKVVFSAIGDQKNIKKLKIHRGNQPHWESYKYQFQKRSIQGTRSSFSSHR
jgi:nitrogen regulatory protein PII-like uncharacterized protein